jgi:fluoride exporter
VTTPPEQPLERPRPGVFDPDIEEPTGAHPTFALGHLLAVIAGGIIGTFLRQALTTHFAPHAGQLPWSVLAINASGCLLIGLVVGAVFEANHRAIAWRLFLVTGILGGWTTYSALAASFVLLLHDHAPGSAVGLWVITIISNVVLAGAGLVAGRSVTKGRST